MKARRLSEAQRRKRAAAYKRVWNEKNRGRYRASQARYTAKFYGYPEPTHPRPARCECCGGKPNGPGRHLHLDHDHVTGVFRGWLCSKCNTGIGLLGDNFNGVQQAARYLRSGR